TNREVAAALPIAAQRAKQTPHRQCTAPPRAVVDPPKLPAVSRPLHQVPKLPAYVSVSLVLLTRSSSPCQGEYPIPARLPHATGHFGSKAKSPNARAREANSAHA